MKTLTMMILAVSTMAMAEQSNSNVSAGASANNLNCGTVHVHCKPTIIYRTKQQEDKVKELEAQVAQFKADIVDLQKKLLAESAENEKLKGLRAHDLSVYRNYVVKSHEVFYREKKAEKGNNAFSIVGGASQTGLSATQTGPTSFTAKTFYEPDFGLMYQHDFSYIRGTVEATVNGTVLLGVGIRF